MTLFLLTLMAIVFAGFELGRIVSFKRYRENMISKSQYQVMNKEFECNYRQIRKRGNSVEDQVKMFKNVHLYLLRELTMENDMIVSLEQEIKQEIIKQRQLIDKDKQLLTMIQNIDSRRINQMIS